MSIHRASPSVFPPTSGSAGHPQNSAVARPAAAAPLLEALGVRRAIVPGRRGREHLRRVRQARLAVALLDAGAAAGLLRILRCRRGPHPHSRGQARARLLRRPWPVVVAGHRRCWPQVVPGHRPQRRPQRCAGAVRLVEHAAAVHRARRWEHDAWQRSRFAHADAGRRSRQRIARPTAHQTRARPGLRERLRVLEK